MTKDKNVYTTPLQLIADPRASHTDADRQAQWELSNKLYAQLGQMSDAVDRINSVRTALDDRAAKLPASDKLVARLRNASAQTDTLRKKIVATKEGGMITGEERLRENLTDLYANVVGYEGRPSQMEVDRTEALGHELADVTRDFNAWTAKELPAINAELAKRKLDAISPNAPQQHAEAGSSRPAAAATFLERD
jgi:hypothetical protein